MSKRSDDRVDGMQDLFASQVDATEGFVNPYAAASQASFRGRGPLQPPETKPSKPPETNPSGTETASSTVAIKKEPVPQASPVSAPEPATATARMMTVKDVAAYVAISVSAVWRLHKKDPAFPPPTRIGGSTRWDKRAIDRYLDQCGKASQTLR